MKRLGIIVLAAVCLLLSSCTANAVPDELSDAFIKRDVLNFVTDSGTADEKTELKKFEKVSSEIAGEEMLVVCSAAFAADGGEQSGEFLLTYTVQNGAWFLSDCNVDWEEKQIEDIPASGQPKENKPESGSSDKTSSDDKNDNSTVSNIPEPEDKNESGEKTDVPAESASTFEEIQMSDELSDFTFMLDGVVYQLPAPYKKFKENGWKLSKLSDIKETDMLASNRDTILFLEKGEDEIIVQAINLSGNKRKIEDCNIGSIDINEYDLKSCLFSIAKGIDMSSTSEQIITAFGEANDIYESEGYVSYTYEFEMYSDVRISTKTNGTKNTFKLRNYAMTEADITETSEEIPDYLSTYVAPTELGDDWKSGNFELMGKLYHLPAPLSEFLDDGWKIYSNKYESIGSENTGAITVKKGTQEIWLNLKNYADYQTIPENCAVREISMSRYQAKDGFTLSLPGGISFASTKTEVENFASEEFEYSSSIEKYIYRDHDRGFELWLGISDKSDIINSITLTSPIWDY